MKVAVLGCGPAGLLATHAAVLDGHDVTVLSIPRRSDLPGTMYLHRSIPEVTSSEPDEVLTYRKIGARETYAGKVYKDPYAPCSWDKFEDGPVDAWNLREAYDTLWTLYAPMIQSCIINPLDLIINITRRYDRVISSIPAKQLCRKPYHKFRYTTIYVGPGCADEVRPREIIYSGSHEHNWYRSSDVFGHQATEYGQLRPGLSRGIKPTKTDCDCWSELILKVGRFGSWDKEQLSHHAFEQAQTYLQGGAPCAVQAVAK